MTEEQMAMKLQYQSISLRANERNDDKDTIPAIRMPAPAYIDSIHSPHLCADNDDRDYMTHEKMKSTEGDERLRKSILTDVYSDDGVYMSDDSEFEDAIGPKINDIYNERERNDIEFYSKALLAIVDKDPIKYLADSDLDPPADIKQFTAVCLHVLAPKGSNSIDKMMEANTKWVNFISLAMVKAKLKRTDQKLRMFYNSLLKMVINERITVPKKCTKLKYQLFLESRNMHDPIMLEALISVGKAPSRKKLKGIFMAFPDICSRFLEIIKEKNFMNSFLEMRELKSKQIVIEYLSLAVKYKGQPRKIAQIIDSTTKAFPWSKEEIETGFDYLYDIVRRAKVAEGHPMVSQFITHPNPLLKPPSRSLPSSGIDKIMNSRELRQRHDRYKPASQHESPPYEDFSFVFLQADSRSLPFSELRISND